MSTKGARLKYCLALESARLAFAYMCCRPHPVVNIIADRPSDTLGAGSALASAHVAEQPPARPSAAKLEAEEVAAGKEAAAQNALQQRLSTMIVLAKKLRG